MALIYLKVLDSDGAVHFLAHEQTTHGGVDYEYRADVLSDPTNDTKARILTANPAAADGALAVRPVTAGTYTEKSSTIGTGGTSQTLMASNVARRAWFVQNISTENLWINFTDAAVADGDSIRLEPGDMYEERSGPVSTETITIIGATTGSKFVAKELT